MSEVCEGCQQCYEQEPVSSDGDGCGVAADAGPSLIPDPLAPR